MPETDESAAASAMWVEEVRWQSWRFLSILLEFDSLLFSLPTAVGAEILGFEPMDLRRWMAELVEARGYGVTGREEWRYGGI